MFIVNEEEKTLYVTRGDVGCFSVSTEIEDGEKYKFQPGDVVRFKVTEKKACDKVVLSKDFGIEAETEEAIIYLEEKDTKIGGVISKPVEYWYEVELNPYTNPQTILGYDEEDGPKIFKLFPEGADVKEEPITPEDIPVVDAELSLTSTRPVQNQAIARAMLKIREENAAEMERHGEFIEGKLSKVTEVEAELDRIAEETETKLTRLDEFAEELERFDEIEEKLTKVDEIETELAGLDKTFVTKTEASACVVHKRTIKNLQIPDDGQIHETMYHLNGFEGIDEILYVRAYTGTYDNRTYEVSIVRQEDSRADRGFYYAFEVYEVTLTGTDEGSEEYVKVLTPVRDTYMDFDIYYIPSVIVDAE